MSTTAPTTSTVHRSPSEVNARAGDRWALLGARLVRSERLGQGKRDAADSEGDAFLRRPRCSRIRLMVHLSSITGIQRDAPRVRPAIDAKAAATPICIRIMQRYGRLSSGPAWGKQVRRGERLCQLP